MATFVCFVCAGSQAQAQAPVEAQAPEPFRLVGALEPGDAQLPSGEWFDAVAYPVDAPTSLSVALSSDVIDAYLIVVDPLGATVAEVDDSEGAGWNVRAIVEATVPGTYTFVVTSAAPGEQGPYALSVGRFVGVAKGATPPAKGPPLTSPSVSSAGQPPAALAAPVAPVPPLEPWEPRAGVARGRVVMPDGRGIDVPGASIDVTWEGVAYASGQNVSVSVTVRPDGSFEQRLVDGRFALARARVQVPFDGQIYWLDLDPVGDASGQVDASEGIVQDFVWRLSGLRPGAPAGSVDPYDWYGSAIIASFQSYRNDVGQGVPQGSPDVRVVFSLVPKGPLADGSVGRTLTFERRYDPLLGGLDERYLMDVPLGVYAMSGVEIAPDGTTTPLLMQLSYAEFVDVVEVRFTPSFGGTTPPIVGFTRRP